MDRICPPVQISPSSELRGVILRAIQAASGNDYGNSAAAYVGSDALPVKGSLSVPAVALRTVLLACQGLAAQGFKHRLSPIIMVVRDTDGF